MGAYSPVDSCKFVAVILPTAIVDNDDFAGAYDDTTPVNIDTLGFGFLHVIATLGASDIAIAEMNLYECDTSNGTFVEIPSADWSDTVYTAEGLPTATDDGKMFMWRVPLDGRRKRYIQVNLKAGDGTAGTYAVAHAILSNAEIVPSTNATRGIEASLTVT